jgi:hypothetical protein
MKMNKKTRTYGDLVAATPDYSPVPLGYVVGIRVDTNIHVVFIDFESDARYKLIVGATAKPNVLTALDARGDWLLREADEIVIDSATTGMSARERRLQQSIMDDVFELCKKMMNVRVRHGRPSPRTRKLSGKQRAIEAAKHGHELKRQELERHLQQSLQQLLKDSAGEEAA